MTRRLLAAVLSLVLIASACSGGDDESSLDTTAAPTTTATGSTETIDASSTSDAPSTTAIPATTEPATEGTSWTFLIYGMGDTDLEPFLLEDLVEMSGAAGDDIEIIALVDRHPEFTDEGVLGLDDFEDTRLLRILSDGVEVLSDEPTEANLGDQQVLADFVEYGMNVWPADHTARHFAAKYCPVGGSVRSP